MLNGYVFVLTGEFRVDEADDARVRADMSQRIEAGGGSIVKTITAQVTHVVAAEGQVKGKRKRELAQCPSVKLLTEAALEALLIVKKPSPVYTFPQSRDEIPSPPPEETPDATSQLLTTTCAPTSLSEVVGNAAAVTALRRWFASWREPKQKKAVLLCGSAGIGKTTLAHLMAREFGYGVLELNASDTRNKAVIESLLPDAASTPAMSAHGVVQRLSNCLIMDECDGMSAGDRGGAAALVAVIRKTRTPIVCICNDAYATAVKTLKAHCQVINFYPPREGECLARLKSIVRAKALSVSDLVLRRIVAECRGDLRQMLIMLQMACVGADTDDVMNQIRGVEAATTDHDISPFQALSRVFERKLTLSEREDVYWPNADLLPLFVHENYLGAAVSIERLASAADSLALGDVVSRAISGSQQWSLAPVQALFSAVAPATVLCGTLGGEQVQFPRALGHGSTTRKWRRVAADVAGALGVNVSDLSHARALLVEPLTVRDKKDTAQVARAVSAVPRTAACLRDRDNFDSLADLALEPDLLARVPAAAKRALTASFVSGSPVISTVVNK